MNNKILLGSILSVVILILVSFTGAVGYQTTSTIARASPLFSVRSKRAIGQGEKDITTDYLGHGEETNIQFSSRMKRTEQAQKAIDIINIMDDRAFSRFVARIISHPKSPEQMTDMETSDVLQALFYIRENPNDVEYYDTENNPIETFEYITCFGFPCLIGWLQSILVLIFAYILGWISSQVSRAHIPTYGCCP